MYLIKIFLALIYILLIGCSSPSPVHYESLDAVNNHNQESKTFVITDSDRNAYRNAITALNNDKLDLAENILKEFLESRQDLSGPWANLGLVYIKKDDIEHALPALQRALQINPNQPHALNLMGIIEYKKGNLVKAIEYYKAAIQNKSDYANAHYNLALLYDVFYQDIPKAVEHYQRYMELTNYQDKQTAIWLEQLVNSLKNS